MVSSLVSLLLSADPVLSLSLAPQSTNILAVFLSQPSVYLNFYSFLSVIYTYRVHSLTYTYPHPPMGIGSSPFRGFGRREPPAVVSQIDGLEPYLPDGPYEKKKSLHGDDVEDMDLLIDELESEADDFEEVEISDDSQSVVPDEFLRTDSITGLSDGEVSIRRKKYGPNKMKEEKENHFLKFLSFFVGPIQFVMEVRCPRFSPSYALCTN